MAAAVAGLAPGSPAPVQIGACRALAQVRGILRAFPAGRWRSLGHRQKQSIAASEQ